MIKGIKRIALIASMAVVGANANAALSVDLSNAVAGNADMFAVGKNEILGDASGFFGANILADAGTVLNFEFLGVDSLLKTKFNVDNNNGQDEKFVNKGVPFFHWNKGKPTNQNDPFSMTILEDGLLDFSFTGKAPFIFWDPKHKVDNGSNPLPAELADGGSNPHCYPLSWLGSEPAYWTGIDYVGDEIKALYLGFNHGYGWINDFDDMVVKISVSGFDEEPSPVPLPAALPLYSAAVFLVAMLRRKKQSLAK